MSALRNVLDSLERHGPVKKQGKEFRCLCPVHGDSTPSLDVSEGKDGRVLFNCRSHGCDWKAIVAALGLEQKDIFPAEPMPSGFFEDRITAVYDYCDERGALLFQTVRLKAPAPKNKDFRQRHQKPGGGWEWSLNGTRRVLYRLPEIVAADPKQTIYVVEGEKDADHLRSLGLIATTNPMGAGKWSKDYAAFLKGRHVVILPDNDEVGQRHAAQVLESLKGVAASAKVVHLAGLDHKGDVSDWIAEQKAGQGETEDLAAIAAELVRYCDTYRDPAAKEVKPKWPAPVPVSQLPERGPAVDWLLHGMIARGHITLLASIFKGGKTTLLGHMLRSFQTGGVFIGRDARECRTLFVSEESSGQWRLRRDALGLDDHLHLICRPVFAKLSFADWIEFVDYIAGIAVGQFDHVVIDTLSYIAPWRNENDSAEVQATINPLYKLTEAGLAVTLFTHHNKADGTEGRGIRGSSALAGSVDIIIELRRLKPEDTEDRRRVLVGMGRFDEIPTEVVIALAEDGSGYTAFGDKKAEAARELRLLILENLPSKLPGATADEIHGDLPADSRPKRGEVMRALQSGAAVGEWERTGTGRKGDPCRFWRAP